VERPPVFLASCEGNFTSKKPIKALQAMGRTSNQGSPYGVIVNEKTSNFDFLDPKSNVHPFVLFPESGEPYFKATTHRIHVEIEFGFDPKRGSWGRGDRSKSCHWKMLGASGENRFTSGERFGRKCWTALRGDATRFGKTGDKHSVSRGINSSEKAISVSVNCHKTSKRVHFN
jgi:hypothetical protein